MTDIVIPTRVAELFEHQRHVRSTKIGNEVVSSYAKVGWFVRFEGSYEALFMGLDRPDLNVGDTVEIRIRKT